MISRLYINTYQRKQATITQLSLSSVIQHVNVLFEAKRIAQHFLKWRNRLSFLV